MSASPPPMSGTIRHYGKYRGVVTNTADPSKLGRIKARVPEVLDQVDTGWALPCTPYAGAKTGVFAIPVKGTGVWIEFEAGDVSRPIWTGCWWQSGNLPTDEGGTEVTTDVRIMRSEQGLMLALHDDSQIVALSDKNGSNCVLIDVQAGKVTVKGKTKIIVDSSAIELTDGASHAVVFGDKLSSFLSTMVSTFNSHTHPGETAGPYPVAPQMPSPTMSSPSSDLLSTKVKAG
jgi:uncharacterized protein involved in type VI secretion and phage assembly